MNSTAKHAIITSFLGKTKDRFHEYNTDTTLEQRLQMVAETKGFDAVEVVYPYEVSDPQEVKAQVQKYGLNIAAVNVNVKAEPEFRDGGLTCGDPAVRARAIQFIKDAKQFARAVNANKVTCCPLNDGYEFTFHCNYGRVWKHLVESLSEAGSYLPEIPLFIEYKPAETRARCFVDTAAKALCLVNDIRLKQIGITMDFGHSVMFGNENPAEALSLIAERGVPYYIHINDNDGRWDWDFFVGTHHLLAYIEFLYWLQEYGYDDYLTSDTSPTRWDIKQTFAANARLTNKLLTRLCQVDRDQLRALVSARDYLKTWQFVEESILRLDFDAS